VEAGTVTFKVEWSDAGASNLWSDTVWVFVDYNKNGKMTRMLLEPGSTLTATSSPGVGKLVEENVKGAWVVGDARTNGSFSATVQLLTATADLYGACAYASSYPPVGQYVSPTEIVFSGTPMYEIWLTSANGVEMIASGSTFLLPCSHTVSSFTDATGAPGILGCIPSTDIYNLTVSATTYCPGGTVTFALDYTTSGRTYQLYKDGNAVDALTGTGSAETFTGTFAGAGNYAVRVKDNGTYCAAQMAGVHTVSESPVPTAPVMGGSSSYCNSGTITATAGNGGTGILWDDGSTLTLRTVNASGTYYAVTTSAAGCTGSTATITVTIGQGAADGRVPDATCGCAEGLADCGGACQASGMAEWTACSHTGFTYISAVSYECGTTMDWGTADKYCKDKGMNLPTSLQLECICANRNTIPGGYIIAYYWSNTVFNPNGHYVTWFDNNYCSTYSNGPLGSYYVKCVK
jgi:hypothetical protein